MSRNDAVGYKRKKKTRRRRSILQNAHELNVRTRFHLIPHRARSSSLSHNKREKDEVKSGNNKRKKLNGTFRALRLFCNRRIFE